ncbi:hypothetical protein FHX44_114117 [Pseudonocardia hierapolitana]|uniref:Uncharacterized protein n=1 Tax=Pseudonocardia hierapolitana TaxID=1128676 RepID=A0A561STK5_9PSEU|nr:hypothetical protein [Pseudonocardia hierapolitana]TWF78198.1 hypothetical protein FHX44_114117 [Pseudonocardia hierapolitana]
MPRPSRTWTAAGAALAAWSGAVLALLFRPWIVHHLFLLGLVLIGSVLVAAIGATAMLVLLLVRRYGSPLAVAMVPVVVAAAMLCFAVDWNVAFARFWFTTHRAEFVAAAELAESGGLGTPGGWDYYGVELPPGLRSISVTGRMAPTALESSRQLDGSVLLVPAYLGFRDGGGGFAHGRGVGREPVHVFGDSSRRAVELGDGWWWVD